MSEMNKKTTNGTVEQIIEHMTADIQNSDGQYIQLGFTPPPTPNDPHIWSEFTQTQLPQNPFMPHYNPRSPEPIPYAMDPNTRYVPQNVPYNNFMPQNTIYVPDASYDKHMDMHGNKFVMYPPNQPQYVMTNPEIPLCNFMFENRECQLFNQEMHQIQQNVPQNELYLPQNQQDMKNKILLQQQQQQQQPTQNRTHLIENLVGNWTSNTNGTYSPFGNVQTQNSTNFFEIKQEPQQLQPQQQLQQPLENSINERTTSDFNAKNLKSNVKKQKQIAEVKPMRPTYSDVLTKSVPQQQNTINNNNNNLNKHETKEVKNKNQVGGKKSAKDKFSKNQLNKQVSNSGSGDNHSFNGKISDKSSLSGDSKVNLSRKWVSLDDVNDGHASKDFLKNELNAETPNSSSKTKKTKKIDNPVASTATNVNASKNNFKKSYPDNNSLGCQWTENDDTSDGFKGEEKNVNKNPNKKAKEPRSNSARQSRFSEKPPGSAKRNQRIRKKDSHSSLGNLGRNVQHYVNRWSKIIFSFLMWLLHLVSDIFSMSIHLGRDFGTLLWDTVKIYSKSLTQNTLTLLKRVKLFTKIGEYIDKTFGGSRFAFWNRWNGNEGSHNRKNSNADGKSWLNSGLEHNINMPTTGEEAMKRLLACKGKDPYSILGVRPDCTDDDIKRYYKRQAFLVHPDKNPQPGAEEAFKILVHAFELIGEPERRQSYDRKVAESHQVEQAWSELNDLLSQLHQKMEYAANTIRCTNCTKRHRRVAVDRPCYAARMCSQCKIHHSAKEGDIWAESTCFGFLWHYYACMDGAVYDITEWAGCQRKNLKHLRPNSHNVQYRIVLGKQAQGGGGSAGQGGPGGPGPGGGPSSGRKHKGSGAGSPGEREADLESFLNNLYSQSDMSATPGAGSSSSHTETGGASASRNRKKNKRKK